MHQIGLSGNTLHVYFLLPKQKKACSVLFEEMLIIKQIELDRMLEREYSLLSFF